MLSSKPVEFELGHALELAIEPCLTLEVCSRLLDQAKIIYNIMHGISAYEEHDDDCG
jgi:hypothetical protein